VVVRLREPGARTRTRTTTRTTTTTTTKVAVTWKGTGEQVEAKE